MHIRTTKAKISLYTPDQPAHPDRLVGIKCNRSMCIVKGGNSVMKNFRKNEKEYLVIIIR